MAGERAVIPSNYHDGGPEQQRAFAVDAALRLAKAHLESGAISGPNFAVDLAASVGDMADAIQKALEVDKK